MPVLWAAFHSIRLVKITVIGVACRKDIDDCADGILTAATLSYSKLVDLTQGSLALSADDLAALANRVRKHDRSGAMGALAIAVRPDNFKQHAPVFEALAAAADRPLKVFCDLQAARDWLDSGPGSPGLDVRARPEGPAVSGIA